MARSSAFGPRESLPPADRGAAFGANDRCTGQQGDAAAVCPVAHARGHGRASVADVADTIKSLGFYKSKAKHAVEAAQMIVADYGGEVPADMKELREAAGRGTQDGEHRAQRGYGIVEGIAVDTHVNPHCASL